LRKLANSLCCRHIYASNYCQQVVNYANV
jgi:hypothetical protein